MGGKEIKEAREAAGLSQEQLAFQTKLHRTYISMLERNINSPTLASLFRICQAVGLKPSTLVARIEKAHPSKTPPSQRLRGAGVGRSSASKPKHG